METYHYTCEYCKKKFIPKRRKVQRFCSASCRVRHYQENNKPDKSKKAGLSKPKFNSKNKVDQMSAAGVGNAALGHAAVELGKAIFTSEQQKSAIKGDIQRLESKFQRYHEVKNAKPLDDGLRPILTCKRIRWFI